MDVGRKHCWLNPKMEVRKTNKYGKGSFATEAIKKGELIAIHAGWLMTRAEEESHKRYRDHGLQITEELVLLSYDDDNYFNHCCNANSGYKGQMFLVAMRNIKPGEEITIDYCTILHESPGAKPYNMTCLCGAKGCRGVVTDDDWKRPELQERYDGYFQYYLQEKIDRMRKRNGRRV